MNTVNTRIENIKKNIEKSEKKLSRIKVALNGGKNPYYYDERDLKRTEGDLSYLIKQLKLYEEKKAINDSIEHIEVIEVFLDAWKLKTKEWYQKDYSKLLDHLENLKIKKQELKAWKIERFGNDWTRNEETKAKEVEMGLDNDSIKEAIKVFSSTTLYLYDNRRTSSFEEMLENLLEKEKVSKRLMLLERVKKITGVIQDACYLTLGPNGEINGYIIGESGTASVETISAGGYNIQCYHFRVLVKEKK